MNNLSGLDIAAEYLLCLKAGSRANEGLGFRTYLSAFATGDLRASLHGRKVRIEASSTHPAQLDLVSRLFGHHGGRMVYPIETPGGWAWRVVYDLGPAFSFLLDARSRTYAALRSRRLFYVAMAGLIDSEGHIGIRKSGPRFRTVVTVTNSDTRLIKLIVGGLLARGYRVSVQRFGPTNSVPRCEVFVYGKAALRLLNKLSLRHREKIEARDAVLHSREAPQKARYDYVQLRLKIRRERDLCVEEARIAFLQRDSRRLERVNTYVKFARTALAMRLTGWSIHQIGISLGRSERTVYRLLRRAQYARKSERQAERTHQPKKPLSAETRIQSH